MLIYQKKFQEITKYCMQHLLRVSPKQIMFLLLDWGCWRGGLATIAARFRCQSSGV